MALMADYLFFCLLFFPVTRYAKGVWLMSASDHLWNNGLFIFDPICLYFLIFIFVYFILLEAYIGCTIGKWLLGLRVIRSDGRKPGLMRSLVRNLLRMADGLPAMNLLGIILIIFTKEKTRLGDMVAGTRVIKRRLKK
jgi:uncharacterized RDD family membrane protein YckC